MKSRETSPLVLPPPNSPLTEVYPGQFMLSLVQESIRFKKSTYADLARAMSMPEPVLKDAVEGKIGLRRGQWKQLCQQIGVATTFQVTIAEHQGAPRWELVYPPVPFGTPDHK